jgi:post-segregation antitoxin (ccd killing protein)
MTTAKVSKLVNRLSALSVDIHKAIQKGNQKEVNKKREQYSKVYKEIISSTVKHSNYDVKV